jgi:hypothetical protein
MADWWVRDKPVGGKGEVTRPHDGNGGKFRAGERLTPDWFPVL